MPESSQSVQPLDRSDRSNDANEIPNKIRRLSADRTTVSSNASVSNASDGDLSHQMFSEDYDSPDPDMKKLDESIENMKSFRNKINTQRLTIQTLSHKLETKTRSLNDCTMKNNDLMRQLDAVRVERDQVKSYAEDELAKLNEKHTALNKAYDDVTAKAKIRIDLLQQEREGLRKGLDDSHTAMLELQRKMNENHKQELNELSMDHEKKLQSALDANETLKLEIKHKADTEAKLKKKGEIVNDFKGKFESLYSSMCQQLQQYE